jgi:hypothetical protein
MLGSLQKDYEFLKMATEDTHACNLSYPDLEIGRIMVQFQQEMGVGKLARSPS